MCIQANPADLLAKLPLTFEENRGQIDGRAQFVASMPNGHVFLTQDGATFALGSGERRAAVKLSFPGSNTEARLTGERDTGAVFSFFKGANSSKWIAGARQFQAVRSHEIRAGVDILYYGNGQQLEYDLVLRPGADAQALRFRFDGSDKLSISPEGNLIIQTAAGIMEQHRPAVYQQNGSNKTNIEATYRLESHNTAALTLSAYDATRELVVDPILSFSTYLGGRNDDSANAIAVDSANNIYVTGFTSSPDFPTSIGAYRVALNATATDVFVTKLNPTGTAIIYSTLIGGANGDVANAIRTDSAGNAIVAGSTQSTDFPTTAGSLAPTQGSRSLFVTKLNSTGTALIYSTYFGSTNGYQDTLTGIAVDSAANTYIVGSTTNSLFPTTLGAFSQTFNNGGQYGYSDAYLSKLNSAGSALVYSTFLGGSQSDAATAVALDPSNQAYVIGSTSSTDFPTSTAAFQRTNPSPLSYYASGFVTCVNASGSALAYSTYLSGSGGATLSAIALDSQQNAYVAGQARSADFPTTNGVFSTAFSGFSEAFVTKLNYNGSSLLYSTFLGGSGDDAAHTIAVDSSGSAIITGTTTSQNFPITPGSFPPVQLFNFYGSLQNVLFLSKLNATASSVLYSTEFGSTTTTVDRALALDSTGNAIIAGNTLSKTLPTTTGTLQRINTDIAGLNVGTPFINKIDLNSTTMCTLSLSVTSVAAPLAGTTGTITVTVNPGCPWEAAASSTNSGTASFVTLSSISGIGNGSFTYTVASNYTTTSSRTSSIVVGSAIATVTQPAGSCTTPGFNVPYQNLDYNGGLNSVSVQLPPGCYYNAIANVPWIQVSSTVTQNGSSSIYYFIPRNDYAARGGSINIAGTQFPILQTGANCVGTLGSSSAAFSSQGGTGVIPFTVSPASCQWSALSYVPWIRPTNSSGTGSGFDSFTVTANPGSASRFGLVLIAGQYFTITQTGGGAALAGSYTINTVAGTGASYSTGSFSGDGGSALGTQLNFPSSAAYDTAGNLYIADSNNYRIRKVDLLGNISTVAGNGISSDSGDGGPATLASLAGPSNLAFDTANNLYFSTPSRVRVIYSNGNVATAAGTNVNGSPADGSPAASAIPSTSGLIVDASGSVYLGDFYGYRIRRLSAGILSYYAGTGTSGFNGDGLAPSATQLSNPRALALDANGAFYFGDGNRIRKVVNGIVTTVAGGGSGDGEGVSATSITLNTNFLAIDAQGSLFYLDGTRLRRVTNGIVNTIAGTANSYSFTGDGGPAMNATFNNPLSIAVDKYGNIAVADGGNNRVRLVTPVFQNCVYALSANNVSVSAAGGTAPIIVTTTSGCAYNTTANASWILVTPSAVGSGTANLTYTPNSTTSARTGTVYLAGQLVTITQAAGTGSPASLPIKVGVMQPQFSAWALDSNGNGGFDAGDRYFSFLTAGTDIAVVGDWTGDGHTKVGVYRSGFFALDTNNNGVWDGPSGGDSFIALGGQPGDIPVVGDWNGDGRTKVGIYRHGFWILDTNGDGVFGPGDQFLAFGGNPGEQPVLGDWNGDGKTKIGFMLNGSWVLDYNCNGMFDSGDRIYSFPYAAGDKAIVGDGNGTHTAKIGIYRAGFWILDYNGNGSYDGPAGGDKFYAYGGNPGEIPIVGDWNGNGTTKIGFYLHGFWCQDFNGNGTFDGFGVGQDRFFALGGSVNEQPVLGAW